MAMLLINLLLGACAKGHDRLIFEFNTNVECVESFYERLYMWVMCE